MHHPVVNKAGDVIASAVTNLDLHDIARAAKTYGVGGYYVITPLSDQQVLARRIVEHWTEGRGGAYNPVRREAISLIRISDSLESAVDDIRRTAGAAPRTVVTCARKGEGALTFDRFRGMLGDGVPYLLVLGTAWGLAPDLMQGADYRLAPIEGSTAYNHLSVRSAAAIILDRLLGGRELNLAFYTVDTDEKRRRRHGSGETD